MRVRMGLWTSPSKTDSLELGMMSPRKRGTDTGTNTALSPEFKREAVELYRSLVVLSGLIRAPLP
jgi:hypothetical protein